MHADSTFMSVKPENSKDFYLFNYPIQDTIILPSDFYTYKILNEYDNLIPITIENFDRSNIYGENNYTYRYSQCCLMLISNVTKNYTNLLGSITFLYENPKSDNLIREYGRLLLLLKNKLNTFIVDYLQNKKVVNILIEKSLKNLTINRLYWENNHSFYKNFTNEMKVYDSSLFENKHIKILCTGWFQCTNSLVHFLYCTIYTSDKKELYDKLDIGLDIIFDENCKLIDVIDDRFKSLINALNEERWKSDKIDWDLKFSSNTKIYINKYILRSFIAQCLDNSLYKHKKLGLPSSVKIYIDDGEIKITDTKSIEGIDQSIIRKEHLYFQHKLESIRNLDCLVYSSTTLTTLYGMIERLNYIGKNKFEFRCTTDFCNENSLDFEVSIKFNNIK